MTAATPQPMTPDQENVFYTDPANHTPQGPPVRPRTRLSEPVPVRFSEELLRRTRAAAVADNRSLSNWIRGAVERELTRTGG